MSLKLAVIAVCAVLLPAQTTPDLKQKAAEYLETAAGLVAAGPPESQAPALLQLAVVQAALDKPRAIELLEQAFAATAALPSVRDNRLRQQTQSLILQQLAKLDLDKAVEKFGAMDLVTASEPDPRAEGIEVIVANLIQTKDTARAIEVLERSAGFGAYSYLGARRILADLPADDERRAALFGHAVSEFHRQPDITGLESIVRAFGPWSTKPMAASLFADAVRSLVSAALDKKGDLNPGSLTMTTAKGTISLTDPQDALLWRLVDLAATVDADLVRRMADGRPALSRLVALYPQGARSLAGGEGVTTTGSVTTEDANSPQAQARQQRLIVETMKFQEVMKYHRTDPAKALEASRAIPTMVLRLRAIGTVARNVDDSDPASAQATLTKCVAALDEIKSAADRAPGWSAIAFGAGRIKDKALASKAILRGIEDTAALYKADADPDNPNLAPRPMWPSVAAFRSLFYQAAKILGEDAGALLEKIPDPQIQGLARLEIAAAWLGVNSSTPMIRTVRKKS